jgi:hypothetical protein
MERPAGLWHAAQCAKTGTSGAREAVNGILGVQWPHVMTFVASPTDEFHLFRLLKDIRAALKS